MLTDTCSPQKRTRPNRYCAGLLQHMYIYVYVVHMLTCKPLLLEPVTAHVYLCLFCAYATVHTLRPNRCCSGLFQHVYIYVYVVHMLTCEPLLLCLSLPSILTCVCIYTFILCTLYYIIPTCIYVYFVHTCILHACDTYLQDWWSGLV